MPGQTLEVATAHHSELNQRCRSLRVDVVLAHPIEHATERCEGHVEVRHDRNMRGCGSLGRVLPAAFTLGRNSAIAVAHPTKVRA